MRRQNPVFRRQPCLFCGGADQYGVEVGDPQPAQEPVPEEDPLVECIRNGIYTAVGLGLLLINRVQTARRDLVGQLPDDLRDAFSHLADQVPEDVRNAVADLARHLPDSVLTVLSDAVEQAPALADALRELVNDGCEANAQEESVNRHFEQT